MSRGSWASLFDSQLIKGDEKLRRIVLTGGEGAVIGFRCSLSRPPPTTLALDPLL